MESSQVLLATEAEAYIQALVPFDLKDIGNPKWFQQHEYIEKINMQAVLNASNQEDEFVKEYLISHEKIPVLVHELITTEAWKEMVFSKIVELELEPPVSFPMYMVLYHEATVANLLETIFFHRETAEAAEDTVLDLVDYCYRKLTQLVTRMSCEEEEEEEPLDSKALTADSFESSHLQELTKQQKTMDFNICIKAVTITRYIIDHLADLPLSTSSRLLNTLDVPILLVQLVESPPWTKTKRGKLMKYVENKWVEIPETDRFKLTKIEGQVWLSIYQLLMSDDCQKKYELSPYRKNSLLKLRSYMTEIMIDQLPVLSDMQRYLEQLSMMDPPAAKKELLLEQFPEIREKIFAKYEGKWKQVAKKQFKNHFNPSKGDMRQQAKRLADTYNFDALENLLTEAPKCVVCGDPATKRCSRCQTEWYCRRECQVSHWKKHKKACDLMAEEVKNQAQEQATS